MNQKAFTPIAIILIIAGVLIIGGGVWYYQNQKAVTSPTVSQQSPPSTTSTQNQKQTDNKVKEYNCFFPGDTWDKIVGACVWREVVGDNQKRAAKIAVEYIGRAEGLRVIQVEAGKCEGCYVVKMLNSSNFIHKFLKDWEVIKYDTESKECENLPLQKDMHRADILRFKLACYLRKGNKEVAIRMFDPFRSKNTGVFALLDQDNMNMLADTLEKAKLETEYGDTRLYREYRYTWYENGVENFVNIGMFKDSNSGEWLITSW